jgi:hypothetical protein
MLNYCRFQKRPETQHFCNSHRKNATEIGALSARQNDFETIFSIFETIFAIFFAKQEQLLRPTNKTNQWKREANLVQHSYETKIEPGSVTKNTKLVPPLGRERCM